MHRYLKKAIGYLAILICVPYFVTVFLNGSGRAGSAEVDATYVRVVQYGSGNGTHAADGDDSEGSGNAGDRKIIEMPLEDYGISVMAKEMPGSYKKEAWKAQAVLVRTAICEKMNQDGRDTVLERSYLTDAQKKQLWGSNKYYSYYNKLTKAWEETDGEILTWKGKPAYVPFCRLTNGSTRDAKESLGEEYPYLKKVTCPKDLEDEWQIQTTMVKNLDAKVTALDSAGYVKKVRVGEETMNGEAFREKYHLASSSFILQKYDGKLRIITCGVGHGYGMSQYTANEMAKKGKTYKEILDYFYKKTEILEVAEIVQGE